MNIEVRIDTSKVDRLISGMPAALARARRKALVDIGGVVKSWAEQTWRAPAKRPAPWAPRKSTKKSDLGRPLLYRSGVMKRDLDYRLQGPDTVVIGTPHDYAKYHQSGTRDMPARPFLPIDRSGNPMPGLQRKVMRVTDDAFKAELGKIGL